jgi:CheY-like chemotaxis protein
MILCIDDELTGLQIRKVLLESRGYEVLTAGSGREGLELFAANPVEAVVLDYLMPEMDGMAVAQELRRRQPDVKILLLSAYVDLPEEIMRIVDARTMKGEAPTALLSAIQQLLTC